MKNKINNTVLKNYGIVIGQYNYQNTKSEDTQELENDPTNTKLYTHIDKLKNMKYALLSILMLCIMGILISSIGPIIKNSITINFLVFNAHIPSKTINFTITLGCFGLAMVIFTIFKTKIELWNAFCQKLKGKTLIKKKKYFIDDDKIYVTILKGKCTYPNCSGTIIITDPPPSEKYNHRIIGVCTTDKLKHTYSIDNNLILTRCPINWTPTNS